VKDRLQRAGGVTQALLDQELIASVSEALVSVGATLQAVEQRKLKRRRRKRIRRSVIGAAMVGGAAFGAWRYGRQRTGSVS
jgi:hypothetical protein